MKLRTATLGCKVNQYETEYVREALQRIGYAGARPGEAADLIVVNTCTVTAESDLKSRKLIRKLARLNPDAEIVVMGCYATHAADEIRRWPQVGPQIVEVVTDKREIGTFLQRRGVVDLPDGITTFGMRHRAYVKIQDGCRAGCAYCIIPKVRPYLLSRPAEEVLDEIRCLVDSGYREIVLTGIHLGHYGLDFPRHNDIDLSEHRKLQAGNTRLTQLAERILEIDLPFRLRLSSMEAVEVTDELIGLAKAFPKKLCPHFHLSMQSGSDTVLRRMRRRWLSAPFYEKCKTISDTLDRAALTTDIIVGFPGETDDEFAETCELVGRVGFSKVHAFPFSPRQGTAAATMPDQIPAPEKERRAAHLTQLAGKLRADYALSLVGKKTQVLFEAAVKGRLVGTSERYLRVETEATQEFAGKLIGQLVDVDVTAADGDLLICSIPTL